MKAWSLWLVGTYGYLCEMSTEPSATIKIFLVYGDPKRLRTAELSNWTGKAVAGPRSEFEGVFSREESSARCGTLSFDGLPS
jgi:hypothetical protein